MKTTDINIEADAPDASTYVVNYDRGEGGMAYGRCFVKATALETRVSVKRGGYGAAKSNGVRMRLEDTVRVFGHDGDEVHAAGREIVVEARHVERPWDARGDEMVAERERRYREQDAITDALLALRAPHATLKGAHVTFDRTALAEWLASLASERTAP